MRILLPLVCAAAMLAPALIVPGVIAPAMAAEKAPLEVTADKSLEWHRDKKLYIARVNAVAKQGATELHGQTLTASYTDGKSGMTINRIEADGDVLVVSDGSRATGDKAYYDLATGYSELTGSNLTLTTPTDSVTARDKMTYDSKKREMSAHGNAKAIRGDDTIVADILTGRFTDDPATGDTKLKELEATGHVVITTPTDVLYGDHGTYNAATNIATINGHVRIERGPNIITGARGEVDLNTNVSRIFGNTTVGAGAGSTTGTGANAGMGAGTGAEPTGDGRVRGVFYPE